MSDDPAHLCPECFSDDVTRVPRRSLRDHLARLFGRRVYRCQECGRRFYDRPSTDRPRPAVDDRRWGRRW
jgi:transposase-like protein